MKKRLFLILTCLMLITGLATARTIRGTVIDASNDEPIIGASVMVKGTSVGIATDINGKFTLDAPDNAKTLMVSYIGMITQEVPIQPTMTIKMEAQSSALDEVVVVAYGTQKKSSITGAISQVNSDAIEVRPVSSAVSALEGSTSGITVTSNVGSPGSSPSIQIRGVGTVNGSNSPLYVIDGVPFGGNVTDINPDDIESMSVLKDAASTALYGNRASNGVILITTKKAKSEKVQLTFKTNQGWYQRGVPEYERANAEQFMRIEYLNGVNNYFSQNKDLARTPENVQKANAYVNSSILERLGINIWDTPDDEIYDANGYLTTTRMRGTYGEDLDWYDQATKNGYRAEYILNGSGATSKSDYYFSVAYLNEEGYVQNSGFERLSGRASINLTPVKWLKTGLNLTATNQKYKNAKGSSSDDLSAYTNPFNYCRNIAPIYPVHAHDVTTGEYIIQEGERIYDPGYYTVDGQTYFTRNQYADRHLIWETDLNSDRTVRNTINAIAYADIILPYGFTASIKGNLNTRTSEQTSYSNKIIGDAKDYGSLSKRIYNYKNWTLLEQLRWNKTYGKHSIQVLLGHENYSYYYDYTFNRKRGEKFANNLVLSNFDTVNDAFGYRNTYRTESYLTRAQYNFDDRYNLEGSFRRDGSSRFHKDSRWGNFGSIGANWVFSNEEFMKDITWLNIGKLRASWGQVGNDAGSGYYAYMSLYSTSSTGTNGGSPAYYMSQLPAAALQWETGESWGIGLEARLFDRWNIEIEYYDKRNKDLIFDVYNPISSGSLDAYPTESTITQNIGTIANRGIEINTDIDIYTSRDWTINLAANLTTLKNKILKLPEQNKSGIKSGSQKIIEGKSRYEWYTYHYVGVDQMTGTALYDIDLDKYFYTDELGNKIGGYSTDPEVTPTEIPAENMTIINGKPYARGTINAKEDFRGTALPSVYGSFTGNFRYKNLSLRAMFTYSLGGKIYDSTYSGLMGTTASPGSYHVDMLNSWFGAPEGMTETSPDRISTSINPEANNSTSSLNYGGGDRWLVSRDYISLKNLNVSYKFPRKFVSRLGIQNIMVSFTGENIFTTASRKGLDPQMGLSGGQWNYIPTARIYTFGLTVNL